MTRAVEQVKGEHRAKDTRGEDASARPEVGHEQLGLPPCVAEPQELHRQRPAVHLHARQAEHRERKLKRGAGEERAERLARGRQVHERRIEIVLLTYCYRGVFPMTLDGEPVTLHEGDCLIADRHCPHAVDELGPGTIAVNVVLNDRFFEKRMPADLNRVGSSFGLALATRGTDHAGWRVYRVADMLSRSCIDLILGEHLDGGIGSADIIDDLCAALITHLIRSNEPDTASPESARKDSELVGRVHEYVAQHYREGRLSALADELGYDASYLSAYIKRETARTFKQLVNEERMRHASRMLRSSQEPIYEIAQSVGISNLTQFYRRFHEYAGMTTQEYRTSPLR